MSNPIRVFITDDHSIVRNGIKATLELIPDIEVVGEAANGRQAVEMAAALNPDVVLMDITMPRMNGMDARADIRLHDRRAKVIMLTALDQRLIATRAVQLGARDFLVKPVLTAQLLAAVNKALG